MFNRIEELARLLTEDPDVFNDYRKKFRENTVLDEEVYGEIVAILKDVAENNGLKLDHKNLKVVFNPAGFSIKNIRLDCPDPSVKRELIQRVAEITGDDNVKHTFNRNLRVNLYYAINKEFADRVRDELNLEVTHQSTDTGSAKDASEVLPMATFTQPAVVAKEPEEEMEVAGPTGAEPEGGPVGPEQGLEELPPEELPEELPEAPPEEMPPPEEPNVGPFGVSPPEEGEGEPSKEAEGEEAPPPEEGEEMVSFEGIQRIADLLTEDPDIFND